MVFQINYFLTSNSIFACTLYYHKTVLYVNVCCCAWHAYFKCRPLKYIFYSSMSFLVWSRIRVMTISYFFECQVSQSAYKLKNDILCRYTIWFYIAISMYIYAPFSFFKSQLVFKSFIKKMLVCIAKTLEMDKGINDKITCMVYLQEACNAAGMNFWNCSVLNLFAAFSN